MGAQPHWFYRHAVVTVVASGFLGLALGTVIAIASLPRDFGLRASEGLRPFGFLAVSGGSFLLGILVGVLLVRAGRSGTECPRCGTLNPEGSAECSACGLSLCVEMAGRLSPVPGSSPGVPRGRRSESPPVGPEAPGLKHVSGG